MILLIQLILAHILGDFFVQPGKWVKHKEEKKWRSVYLYLHAMIHFALVMLITLQPRLWKQALIIALLHLLVDGLKLQWQSDTTKRRWFFADQFLHIVVIMCVWSYSEKMIPDLSWLSDRKVLVPVTAILFLIYPASFIIKTAISKWTPQDIPGNGADSPLVNAGQWIGIMERLLVLVFILMEKWEGVGFLLAAKSVFRFGDLKDAKDMKLTEYVLIGTFLSFGIAILTGIITLKLPGV